jgi:hypothetical protein
MKAARLAHAFRAACRLDEGLESTVLTGHPVSTAAGHGTGS